jgi:hypothetical protein
MPATTSWKKSDAAAELFGHAAATDANTVAASSSYQLIGVFANPTAGFAVVLVDGKQVGVGLGGEVSPGMRLVETAATYVLLERGGVKQRVELQAGKTADSGITRVASATPSNNLVLPAPAAFEADDELSKIPPEQRDAMRRELENFRRRR